MGSKRTTHVSNAATASDMSLSLLADLLEDATDEFEEDATIAAVDLFFTKALELEVAAFAKIVQHLLIRSLQQVGEAP